MSDKDKEKSEQVLKRNQLDELVYTTDKSFQELGDGLSEEEKKELEQALEEGREALKSDDPGKIDVATEKITAVSHKLAELMYKKQQEESPIFDPLWLPVLSYAFRHTHLHIFEGVFPTSDKSPRHGR